MGGAKDRAQAQNEANAEIDDPIVNWRNEKQGYGGSSPYGGSAYTLAPTNYNSYDLESEIYNMRTENPAGFFQMAKDLYKAGMVTSTALKGDPAALYNGVEKARRGFLTKKNRVESDTLTDYIADLGANGKTPLPGGGGGGGGGGAYYFRNETVIQTNRDDARAAVDNALGQWLGRSATKEEVDKFWKSLNAYEKKNPYIAEGVSGKGGTKQTQKGRTNTAVFAEDYAKSQDDYAETSIVTRAEDAIKQVFLSNDAEELNP